MATAIASGCDFAGSWPTEATDIKNTVFANSASDNSTGPAVGTKMSFVGRYIGSGLNGGGASGTFSITSTELNSLVTNGLSVFFFYESNLILPQVYPSNYQTNTTFAQGVLDAKDAQNYLRNVLGIDPTNQPVYFAVDYDAGIITGDVAALSNYFSGVNSIFGTNTGLYGSGLLWQSFGQGSGSQTAFYYCQAASSGWTNSGNYLAGQNLWQWPPGYSPSGSVTINGRSVDGEFAYTNDYGQYPRYHPIPPTLGQLAQGTTTVGAVTYSQPAKQTIIVPNNNYDKVLWSQKKGTLSVPNVSNYTHTYTIANTGIAQPAYPIGNFTYDGVTYVDMGFFPSNHTSVYPWYGKFYGPLPIMVIQPTVDTNGTLYFNVAVQQAYQPSGSALSAPPFLDITYDIALMAQVDATRVPDSPGVSQAISFSNANQSVQKQSNYATYRRIYQDLLLVPGNNVIEHNLGVVPNILFWASVGGTTVINSSTWSANGKLSGNLGVTMDQNNVYLFIDSPFVDSVYLRIYQDN